MKTKLMILGAILLMASIYGCRGTKDIGVSYNYEAECMGTGRDGTQLIKIWGYGRSASEAIESAKKEAVHTIIFKGIQAGKSGCMTKPLAPNPSTERQHQAYFEQFFGEGGPYLRFVARSGDGTINPHDRLRVGKEYKIGVIVTVMHSALRKELEAAGVIKSLNAGF